MILLFLTFSLQLKGRPFLKEEPTAVDWFSTKGNKVVDADGKEARLTGLNWFGYATGTGTFDGIYATNFVDMITAIADHGFNIIRVPFSVQILLEFKKGITSEEPHVNHAYNPELDGMDGIDIFDFFVDQLRINGVKAFIDIHCVDTDQLGHMYEVWYNSKYSPEQLIEGLEWIVDKYKDNDVIIGVDVKNEPHGTTETDPHAIWNDSTDKQNWKHFAETAAAAVHKINPNLLIFVEGIEYYPKDIATNGDFHSSNADDYLYNWWGGNLRGVADFPVNLGSHQNKLVYSPHDYGPGVYDKQPWFIGGFDYDRLLKECWTPNWFYIHDQGIAPLLIGEWGGRLEGDNVKWMQALAKLISTYGLHHTFWCFNPNSGDTGGLVKDDWTTWDDAKYAVVKPTLWQTSGGKFIGLSSTVPLGKNGVSRSQA